MKRVHTTRRRASGGFMLLEAMVSILVVTVALLLAARLQVRALAMGNDGNHRQQAMALVGQMGDRVRANMEGFKAKAYDSFSSTSAGTATTCLQTSTGCTTGSAMAADDMIGWALDIKDSKLPNAVGNVCYANSADVSDANSHLVSCTSTGNVLLIQLQWQKNSDEPVSRFSMALRP